MNRKIKIPAFTLSELILVMVITIIVIGLAYSVLSLVQSHMKGISYNFENATEINLMEQALTRDLNTYGQSKTNRSGHIVYSNELDSVTYEFVGNSLIRELDTFGIVLDRIEFFMDNKEVRSGKFNAIKVFINLDKKKEEIFIYKQNDAKTYIN